MLKNFITNWILAPKFRIYSQIAIKKALRICSKTSPGIKKFKNIHQGKRCFILATGPSINQMELSVLKDEVTIAVSFFGYHKNLYEISPKYHVFAPNHEPLGEKNALNFLQMIKDCYKVKPVCFFGISNYEHSLDRVISRNPELEPQEHYFIDYSYSLPITDETVKLRSLWEPCGNPLVTSTVAFEAIMMAVYMGCTEIYLLGCDFNYLKDLEGRTNQHFYADEKTVQGREKINTGELESFFKSSYDLWKKYRMINECLSSRGVSVYNASPDSLLDMFPKVRFETLF